MSEAERWQRVKAIFDAAAACRAEDRVALLRERCGNDQALQAEVESLLAADARQEPIFDQPVDRDLRGRVFGAVAGALAAGAHALKQGDRLGGYEISGLIGTGGMGEVYRARDTKLNRSVALKILPNSFASDPDRLARFAREAQLLASLNHPNIAHIYGLEDAHVAASGRSASPALVLELVEGPTLADRIAQAPAARGLPLTDAWPIARQIAAALEAAHEQGVVHRDLKPANVKVRADGIVKVLDFGLARALGTDDPSSSAEAMDSPTMTSPGPLTESRVILGTVPYMSPEQARGKVVDKRADIWAFGCVLFEMLAGRRAFDGETSSDTIAAILERQPDWEALPNATPANIRLLLQRCLEKDPKRRLRDIGDARIEIEHVDRPTSDVASNTPRESPAHSKNGSTILAAGLLAAVALAAVVGVIYFTGSRPAALKYTRITDFVDSVTAPSLSPDGSMVTFKRGGGFFQTVGQIYVKMLPNGDTRQLTTDNTVKIGPVFTPDGSRIAYTQVSEGNWETWTVPVLGGQPTRLLPNAAGLTWIGDGRILFSEIKGVGLHMGIVTASELRADAREIYFPEHERAMAHFSHLSPDRKSVIVIEMDRLGAFQQCRLVPFEGSSSGRPVGPKGSCTDAGWSPGGDRMYFTAIVDGVSHLWQQAFPDGLPEQLTSGPNEEQGVAVAQDGAIITSVGTDRSVVWFHDENGNRAISSEGVAVFPRVSRDGKRVFYLHRSEQASSTSSDLRAMEVTSGKSMSLLPGWAVRDFDLSDDETDVVFSVVPDDGEPQIWLASLDRRSPPREITRGGTQASFVGNNALVYRLADKNANYLYRINLDGSGRERVASTPILEKGHTSPDGAWVMATIPTAGESQAPGRTQRRTASLAIPVRGGTPRTVCALLCRANWSSDGKFFQITLRAAQSSAERDTTVVIPVPAGKTLPDLPEGGIDSKEDALKLPGARAIEEEGVSVAPNGSSYAFVRRTIQRNLFRIDIR